MFLRKCCIDFSGWEEEEPSSAFGTFSHPKKDGRRQMNYPSPVPLGMGEGAEGG
jgi:hypothetical protein